MTDRRGNLTRFVCILFATALLWACQGDDGPAGPEGPEGPAGQPGAPGQPGPPADDVIVIGDGMALTEEEIAFLGKLQATITSVTVSSPPVVEFTVLDQHGNGAVGIAPGRIQFTFAKLVPGGDPDVNGGLAYWQSYLNRARTSNREGGIPNAIQATTDSSGTLEELVDVGPGLYRYTFSQDVTQITTPIEVLWEPGLTHRVGLEIRLDGPGEVPLAPFNPVKDFVPNNGPGSGMTKDIADTNNCAGCHFEFQMHGGPRKSVEYCVTCHNPGSVDPDTGESVDMAYLAHSIHMGERREPPFGIVGFTGLHFYGDLKYPQAQVYCETCHVASGSHPDGNAWNEGASAKSCGGCHADGLLADNFDPVTGQAEYQFDHTLAGADAPIGPYPDGACNGCHLGNIQTAGPALSIHSRVNTSPDNQRFREETGTNFVFKILGATNTGPGETPVITFEVRDKDGEAYDILTAPEFNDNDASLNLYVAWSTDDIYNGDETGATNLGLRDRGASVGPYDVGHPHRMELAALQRDIAANPDWVNPDGSYTVTYFTSIPENVSGGVMISLGGHPRYQAIDKDNIAVDVRAAAVSEVFFPGAERVLAVDSDKCSACHKQLQRHGANRNGNMAMCINCHAADTVADGEGWAFGRMIHSIHDGSPTFAGGGFVGVKFPYGEQVANCNACHVEGRYDVARTTARSVSIAGGASDTSWLDDIATTPTAANCGACHTSIAALGHFNTQGAQVGVPKDDILKVEGMPNGQEACAVCHGTGSTFETAKFHNPGLLVEE